MPALISVSVLAFVGLERRNRLVEHGFGICGRAFRQCGVGKDGSADGVSKGVGEIGACANWSRLAVSHLLTLNGTWSRHSKFDRTISELGSEGEVSLAGSEVRFPRSRRKQRLSRSRAGKKSAGEIDCLPIQLICFEVSD